MDAQDFERRLAALRPKLHRYCARMVGSSIDGEDVLQDAIVRAVAAQADGVRVHNLEGWLLRIAHNASLDFLRRRARDVSQSLQLTAPDAVAQEQDTVAFAFQTFMRLSEAQRCVVILKDVLGYSVEEISKISGFTRPAAKSALQRGRATLRRLAAVAGTARASSPSRETQIKVAEFVDLFRRGEFDQLRAALAHDVKLDLVNRVKFSGSDTVSEYFSRYAEQTRWEFELGCIEQRSAMLVFDRDRRASPNHVVLVEWEGPQIQTIRDFLFANYIMDGLDWTRLDGSSDKASPVRPF